MYGSTQPLVECAVAVQILVLGFCDSQRDLEVVQKILSQARTRDSSACAYFARIIEPKSQSAQGGVMSVLCMNDADLLCVRI